MIILSTKLKNAINAHSNGMDLTFTLRDISINGNKRGCSGFIRNNANGSVVYVTTEEPCMSNLHYMYRYANNEKDFKGYHNRWANTLDELASAICTCLHKTPQEVNDRRVKMQNFIDRIHAEQTQYLADIAQLPPDQIIAKAYEIFYRNMFLYVLASTIFDDDTMAVLMNTPHILDVLYDEWLKTDASVCNMLEDVIRDFAESEVENNA